MTDKSFEEIGVEIANEARDIANILDKHHARLDAPGVVAVLYYAMALFCARKEGPRGSGLTICKYQMMEWAKDFPLNSDLIVYSQIRKEILATPRPGASRTTEQP